MENTEEILRKRIDNNNYEKLLEINNPELYSFVAKYIELCNPRSVFISNSSPEDIDYIRRKYDSF